jgi:hypothetical protein
MKLGISLVAIAAALGCAAPATAAHPQRPGGPVLGQANIIPASSCHSQLCQARAKGSGQ